jgi:hypothetical protein
MTDPATLRALTVSFDRFFEFENDGKIHEPRCHWTEHLDGTQEIRCKKAIGQGFDPSKEAFDIHALEDEVQLLQVPHGIYKWAFCANHQEAYNNLCNELLQDIIRLPDFLSQPASPGSERSCGLPGPELDHDRNGRPEYGCHADKLLDGDYGSFGADWDEGSDNEEVVGETRISQGRKKRVKIFSNGSLDVVDISTHGLEDSSPVVDGHNDGNTDLGRVPFLDDQFSNGPHTPRRPATMPSPDSASRLRNLQDRLMESPEERLSGAALTSLLADSSYEHDPAVNELLVRRRIQSPLVFTEKNFWQEGFVYVFRDKALGLVKIGSTFRKIDERRKDIETRCKIRRGLTVVGFVRVLAYKWLEKVVHQDLAPHRWFFNCECGGTREIPKFTKHQEFFLISDDAAMRTLRFWASFVKEQHPWVRHPQTDPIYSPEAIKLKSTWLKKLDAPHKVKAEEKHEYHDMRIDRWCRLLGIVEPDSRGVSIDKSLALRPAVATAALTSTNPPPDSRTSQQPIPSIRTSLEENGSTHTQKQSSEAPKEVPLSGSDRVKAIPDTGDGAQSGRAIKPLPTKKRSPLIETKALEAETFKSTLLSEQHSNSAYGRPRSVPALEGIEGKSLFGSIGEQSSSFSTAPLRSGDYRDINLGEPVLFRSQPPAGYTPFDQKFVLTSPSTDRGQNPSPPKRPATEAANDDNPGIQTEESNVPCEEGKVQDHHHRPQQHSEEQKSTTSVLPNQNPEEATLSVETLLQSSLTLATKFLAKDVQPMPLRTISADLWQLRWPLACSVAFALQSPYMPPALSFVMWSIFLPFFVAELRAWNGKGQK